MNTGIGGIIRDSGTPIKVFFDGIDGEEVADGTFEGVGTDYADGAPIIYVDEGEPTFSSVDFGSVTRIEGDA